MDDMNDSASRELEPLNAMNCSRRWIIRMILCHDLKALSFMNRSGLHHELKPRDAMNNSDYG